MFLRLSLLISFLLGQIAFGETELSCWGIKDRRGSLPVLTAKIRSDNELTNVQLDFEHKWFENYAFENSSNKGGKFKEVSQVFQPRDRSMMGQEITQKRSPYLGHQEFAFVFGNYEYESARYKNKSEYNARWILPTDLSNENLKMVRLRNPTERSNSVLIFDPSRAASQAGQNYLRMFCVSR